MADYGLNQSTPTERKIKYLATYLFDIFNDLTRLELGLESNESLKDFPNYRKLLEVTGTLGKYVKELNEYLKDARSLVKSKDWIGRAYKFLKESVYSVASDIEKYKSSKFRERWEDDLTPDLDRNKYTIKDVESSKKILSELGEMEDVEPELVEKSKKLKSKLEPEAKVVAIILILGLSFGTLSVLNSAPSDLQLGTGSSIFPSVPTGNFPNVGLELIYVIISSIIISIYVFGKLTKKW